MTMKSLTIFAAFAVLIACDPISGGLQVKQSFQAKVATAPCNPEDPNCNPHQSDRVTIASGSYQAVFQAHSRTSASITVKRSSGNVSLPLTIPRGRELPSWEGDFALTARESGQPFDLVGSLRTEQTRSDEMAGVESCTRTVREYVCHGHGRHRRCSDITRVIHGRRDVAYYMQYTRKFLAAEVRKAGASTVFATFGGDHLSTEKVYTFQGLCF